MVGGGRREGGRDWLGEGGGKEGESGWGRKKGKNGGWVIMKKSRRGERVEGGEG